jgi:hypothetical protein
MFGTSHFLTVPLYRTLLFRQQVPIQTAILISGWVFAWRHCGTVKCAYEASFAAVAGALRWASLPALAALAVRPSEARLWTVVLGSPDKPDGWGEAQGCVRDCFVVHGTSMATLGYMLPLLIGKGSRGIPLYRSSCPRADPGAAFEVHVQCLHRLPAVWLMPGTPCQCHTVHFAGLGWAGRTCRAVRIGIHASPCWARNHPGPAGECAESPLLLTGDCLLHPHAAVYRREQMLRQRFLAAESQPAASPAGGPGDLCWLRDPGIQRAEKVALFVVVFSGLCLAVQLLAQGGMAGLMGESQCGRPGA